MRHIILEEPLSAAAVWSRRLAIFALAVAALAVILSRSQGIEPAAGLSVLAAAIVIACIAVLLAVAAFVIIWRTGRRGVGHVVAGLFLALLLLALPAWLAVQSVRLPVINDVSTDLLDPPAYARSSRALAARNGVTPGDIPEASRVAQRIAYPNLQPIILDLEADEAYQLVLRAVAARGWRIVDQAAPGGRMGLGHVNATDRTLLMGFTDDIAIRIRPLAGQTRIDVRSTSRIGRHDFRANATRIEKFVTELQAQLDAR